VNGTLDAAFPRRAPSTSSSSTANGGDDTLSISNPTRTTTTRLNFTAATGKRLRSAPQQDNGATLARVTPAMTRITAELCVTTSMRHGK